MARNKLYNPDSDEQPTNDSLSESTDSATPNLEHQGFDGYVVAIGASAGGLDALEKFFDELQPDSGAAFIVIQHLSPDHKSMMDNLLGRHTTMPVLMAENGIVIKENHVYLIPPGKNMTVANSKLRLIPKNPHVLSLPIDLFFTSMAKEFGRHSVGVVLSGTGSDGTRGAVAINDAGGFLLAQDPQTAKFDGMPRSVIATGLVDEILPPTELARRIVSYVNSPLEPRVKVSRTSPVEDTEDVIDQMFNLLYEVCGINFKEYKSATVQRRIERRMQVRHVRDLRNYLHLLESDRDEVHTLKRDTLIPVTSFFRDPETFLALEKTVIGQIVQTARERQPIRVWVAGCSTGEEAYTIAILFAEAFDLLKRWPHIKIFATDVEQRYIDFASAGTYPESIVNELSAERLERFFNRNGKQYTIKTEVRQNIVFARHNLLEDPPFTRMNLVSCRNTLIYFDTVAQEKALLRLQYALVHNGYLLLGSSESLGAMQRDYSVINAKHKLYQVIRPVTLPLDLKTNAIQPAFRKRAQSRGDKVLSPEAAFIEAAQNQLIKQYVPPALLINGDRELVHVYGDAQRFLQIPEGQASLEISKLLAGKLASVGIALIHKASKENISLRSDALFVQPSTGVSEHLHLTAMPLENTGSGEHYYLLTFEPATGHDGGRIESEGLDIAAITNERIQGLEYDLSMTRDSLQATIEELETANEELQATNEELMASNEELQSTNEELQSVNEELYTVNSENQEKIEILNRLNADLDNMTRAALIPTIFVDADLKLTRFTQEASRVFPLRDTDIGRPISDFAHNLDYPEFIADLRRTVDTAQIVEREVKTFDDGRWYLARLLPYIDNPRNINGAVITLFEITHIKDAKLLQSIVDSLPEHIAVLDAGGRITLVNKAWRDFAEFNGDRGLLHTGPGANYLDVCRSSPGKDANIASAVLEGIKKVLAGELQDFSIQYPCHSPIERRWFLMHAAPVRHAQGGVVVSHINITEWMEAQGAANAS